MNDANTFHKLAKDAGNRLGSYILNYASAATGIFFMALTQNVITSFTIYQKSFLFIAFILYVATILIRLLEIHIDARRFYTVAKQLEKPEIEQDWSDNEHYQRLRLKLIYSSYITLIAATGFSLVFMISRVG